MAGEPRSLRIAVDDDGSTLYLHLPEILYLEADGHDTLVHAELDTTPFRSIKPLGELEEKLAASSFFRSHYSFIVNLDRVRRLRRNGDDLQLELEGARRTVPLARRRLQDFRRRIEDADDNGAALSD